MVEFARGKLIYVSDSDELWMVRIVYSVWREWDRRVDELEAENGSNRVPLS